MPNRNARNRVALTQAEIMAAYMDAREDELLDAVVTAAALVAHADGCIEPVERSQLLDFLNRNGLISLHTRAEILDLFERRVRLLADANGTEAAVEGLRRLAGRSTARLVIDAGDHIAAANGHLHPRELQVLQVIRTAVASRFQPLAPSAS
jgi:tellurite resistance protein